jgi:broad specificity phosphatase PhoE
MLKSCEQDLTSPMSSASFFLQESLASDTLPDAYEYLEKISANKSHRVTRFIVCRHGESYANQAGYVAGQTASNLKLKINTNGSENEVSFSALTEEGTRQAKEIGEKLQKAGVQIYAAYTSPLQRAVKTAAEILKAVGFKNETIEEKSLIEKHFGRDESVSNQIYKLAYVQEESDFKKIISWKDRFKYKVWPDDENLESLIQVYKRSVDFLKKIAPNHKGQNLLISTHKVVMKTLLMGILNESKGYEVPYRDFDLKNGSVFVIEISENEIRLVAANGITFGGSRNKR